MIDKGTKVSVREFEMWCAKGCAHGGIFLCKRLTCGLGDHQHAIILLQNSM